MFCLRDRNLAEVQHLLKAAKRYSEKRKDELLVEGIDFLEEAIAIYCPFPEVREAALDRSILRTFVKNYKNCKITFNEIQLRISYTTDRKNKYVMVNYLGDIISGTDTLVTVKDNGIAYAKVGDPVILCTEITAGRESGATKKTYRVGPLRYLDGITNEDIKQEFMDMENITSFNQNYMGLANRYNLYCYDCNLTKIKKKAKKKAKTETSNV